MRYLEKYIILVTCKIEDDEPDKRGFSSKRAKSKKMMEALLRKLLASKTETEVLEFKEAKNSYSKDKLGKYFSALSNEANLKGKPCAWLLFGVKNDKTVVGTSISDKQLNEYKVEMAQHTSPKLSFINIHQVNYEGKGFLIKSSR